jgi:hypothetical protein
MHATIFLDLSAADSIFNYTMHCRRNNTRLIDSREKTIHISDITVKIGMRGAAAATVHFHE